MRYLIVCESEGYSKIVAGSVVNAINIADMSVRCDKTVEIYEGLYAQGTPVATRVHGKW